MLEVLKKIMYIQTRQTDRLCQSLYMSRLLTTEFHKFRLAMGKLKRGTNSPYENWFVRDIII